LADPVSAKMRGERPKMGIYATGTPDEQEAASRRLFGLSEGLIVKRGLTG